MNLAVQAMLGKHGIRSAPPNDLSLYNNDDEANDAILTDASSIAPAGVFAATAPSRTSVAALSDDYTAAEVMDEEDCFFRNSLDGDMNSESDSSPVSDETEEEEEEEEEATEENQVQTPGMNPLDKLRKGVRKVR